MKVIEYIDPMNFARFHRLLAQQGGRYLANPLESNGKIRVEYDPGRGGVSLGDTLIENCKVRRTRFRRILERLSLLMRR